MLKKSGTANLFLLKKEICSAAAEQGSRTEI
jgi:hypothetical protein